LNALASLALLIYIDNTFIKILMIYDEGGGGGEEVEMMMEMGQPR
jgi:hypothetical protein